MQRQLFVGPAEKEVPAVTWQEEKAKTRVMMSDIVAQIPKDAVVRAEVKGTGTLFGCNQGGPNGEKLHSWTGSATVVLRPGVAVDPIVKAIESHYRDKEFKTSSGLDAFGDYEIHVKPSGENSSHIVSKDSPNQISILSWSECFQLPEGLYPGGDF